MLSKKLNTNKQILFEYPDQSLVNKTFQSRQQILHILNKYQLIQKQLDQQFQQKYDNQNKNNNLQNNNINPYNQYLNQYLQQQTKPQYNLYQKKSCFGNSTQADLDEQNFLQPIVKETFKHKRQIFEPLSQIMEQQEQNQEQSKSLNNLSNLNSNNQNSNLYKSFLQNSNKNGILSENDNISQKSFSQNTSKLINKNKNEKNLFKKKSQKRDGSNQQINQNSQMDIQNLQLSQQLQKETFIQQGSLYPNFLPSSKQRPNQKYKVQFRFSPSASLRFPVQYINMFCTNVNCNAMLTFYRNGRQSHFKIITFNNKHNHQPWEQYSKRSLKAQKYLKKMVQNYVFQKQQQKKQTLKNNLTYDYCQKPIQNVLNAVNKIVYQFYSQKAYMKLLQINRININLQTYYSILSQMLFQENIKLLDIQMKLRDCQYFIKKHKNNLRNVIPHVILYCDPIMRLYQKRYADAIKIQKINLGKGVRLFFMKQQIFKLFDNKILSTYHVTELIIVKGISEKNKEIILAAALLNGPYDSKVQKYKREKIIAYSWILEKLFSKNIPNQQSISLGLCPQTVLISSSKTYTLQQKNLVLSAVLISWRRALILFEKYQEKRLKQFEKNIQANAFNQIKTKFVLLGHDFRSYFYDQLQKRLRLNRKNSQIIPIIKSIIEERDLRNAKIKLDQLKKIIPHCDFKYIKGQLSDQYNTKNSKQIQSNGMGYYNIGPRFFGFFLGSISTFSIKEATEFKKQVTFRKILNFCENHNISRQSKYGQQEKLVMQMETNINNKKSFVSCISYDTLKLYNDEKLYKVLKILNSQQLRFNFLKQYKNALIINDINFSTLKKYNKQDKNTKITQQNMKQVMYCTCLYRQQTGFPCCHQILFCKLNKMNYDFLIKDRWKNLTRIKRLQNGQDDFLQQIIVEQSDKKTIIKRNLKKNLNNIQTIQLQDQDIQEIDEESQNPNFLSKEIQQLKQMNIALKNSITANFKSENNNINLANLTAANQAMSMNQQTQTVQNSLNIHLNHQNNDRQQSTNILNNQINLQNKEKTLIQLPYQNKTSISIKPFQDVILDKQQKRKKAQQSVQNVIMKYADDQIKKFKKQNNLMNSTQNHNYNENNQERKLNLKDKDQQDSLNQIMEYIQENFQKNSQSQMDLEQQINIFDIQEQIKKTQLQKKKINIMNKFTLQNTSMNRQTNHNFKNIKRQIEESKQDKNKNQQINLIDDYEDFEKNFINRKKQNSFLCNHKKVSQLIKNKKIINLEQPEKPLEQMKIINRSQMKNNLLKKSAQNIRNNQNINIQKGNAIFDIKNIKKQKQYHNKNNSKDNPIYL